MNRISKTLPLLFILGLFIYVLAGFRACSAATLYVAQSDSTITITAKRPITVSLTISNIIGVPVLEFRRLYLSKGKNTFNLQRFNLSAGVYILVLSGDNIHIVIRIIIKSCVSNSSGPTSPALFGIDGGREGTTAAFAISSVRGRCAVTKLLDCGRRPSLGFDSEGDFFGYFLCPVKESNIIRSTTISISQILFCAEGCICLLQGFSFSFAKRKNIMTQ